MKSSKWVFLFIAGAILSYHGAFAPWHELGHIIKSAEHGGQVITLEWARVMLSYMDYDVMIFGYGWEYFTTFGMMLLVAALGYQYKWSWPAWGFFFGMLHGTWYVGRNSIDFINAARLSGKALAEIVRLWDILSVGFLGFTWAIILLSIGLSGIKRAAAAAHERGFSH